MTASNSLEDILSEVDEVETKKMKTDESGRTYNILGEFQCYGVDREWLAGVDRN